MPSHQRAVVSVTAIARLCGLSRQRFYELVAEGIMPPPCYDIRTRRPIYPIELQAICLAVRATNIGFDGHYILFYEPRPQGPSQPPPRRRQAARTAELTALREGLASLGLAAPNDQVLSETVAVLYSNGTAGVEPGDVLRSVFRHLRRQLAACPAPAPGQSVV